MSPGKKQGLLFQGVNETDETNETLEIGNVSAVSNISSISGRNEKGKSPGDIAEDPKKKFPEASIANFLCRGDSKIDLPWVESVSTTKGDRMRVCQECYEDWRKL